MFHFPFCFLKKVYYLQKQKNLYIYIKITIHDKYNNMK